MPKNIAFISIRYVPKISLRRQAYCRPSPTDFSVGRFSVCVARGTALISNRARSVRAADKRHQQNQNKFRCAQKTYQQSRTRQLINLHREDDKTNRRTERGNQLTKVKQAIVARDS